MLAALERGRVGGQVLGAAGRVGEPVGLASLDQKLGHGRRAGLGRAPIGGVGFRRRDRDRVDRLAAEERIEVTHPFFAVEADVDIDAIQRREHADRVRAVLEDARRPGGRRRVECAGKLLVVELRALERLPAPQFGLRQPGSEQVDRVHGARVVDVVGRDERGVHRARRIGMHELIEKVLASPRSRRTPGPSRDIARRRSS